MINLKDNVYKMMGELRRDADRYRAIRKLHWHDSEYCFVHNPIENVKLGVMCPSENQLDAIADALIEAQKK